jgi:hypothetical protein
VTNPPGDKPGATESCQTLNGGTLGRRLSLACAPRPSPPGRPSKDAPNWNCTTASTADVGGSSVSVAAMMADISVSAYSSEIINESGK